MILLKENNNKSLYDLKVTKKNRVKLEKIKEGKKISILSDIMFKAMFQNEKRIKYSAKLISYFIDVDYKTILENLRFTKNELDKEKYETKSERCDYVAEINNTILNIEVNNNTNEEMLERNIEYAFKLYGGKVKVGTKDYKYRQVVQFNINNFEFEENDKIIDIYTIRNKEGIDLTKKLIFVQIYIPNLMKKCYNVGIENLEEREQYIMALVEQDLEKLSKIGDDIIMNEYIEEATEVSFNNGFGESYDKELALKEMYIEEGMEEGIKQNQIETAKKMINKNMDIEDIIDITNLTQEEIEELMNENL